MRRFLREPLLHFVIAGGLLYGLSAWLDTPQPGGGGAQTRQIRIGEGEVKWLVETWSGQWRRQPTEEELRGLAAEWLKQEVLAREARDMGLDKNDTIVHRRLAQKLEFLLQDTSRLADPTDAELRKLYEGQLERFQVARRVTLTHVYFSPQRRNEAAADARRALEQLSGTDTVDVAALGDPSVLDPAVHDADERALAALFGPAFAGKVMALEAGAWHGPIASSYGMHIVRLTEATASRPRSFEEVRVEVADLWRERQRRETEERYLRRVMDKYEIVIDESVRSRIGPLPLAQRSGDAP